MGTKATKQQAFNSTSFQQPSTDSSRQQYQAIHRGYATWRNQKAMSGGYIINAPVKEKENDLPKHYSVSSKADALQNVFPRLRNDDYQKKNYTLPRKALALQRSQSFDHLSSSKRVITVPEIIYAQQKRRNKPPTAEISAYASPSQKIERSTSSTNVNQFSSAHKRPKLSDDLQFVLINANDIKNVRKIGQGNFGTVHHAVYQGSRDVALKTLNLHNEKTSRGSHGDYDDHMYELLHEASIMTQLKHVNLLRILGVTFLGEKQQLSLVTEFMKNGSLLDYLRKHRESFSKSDSRLVTKKLNHLARQILEGMFYLEEKGIIHRDLAARNCLIGEEDTLKVGDFGLTKLTDCGLYKGTYRTGITLWELYTLGDRPLFPTMTNIGVRSLLANSSANLSLHLPKPTYIGSDKTYTHVILPCLTYTTAMRPRFRDLRRTFLSVTDGI